MRPLLLAAAFALAGITGCGVAVDAPLDEHAPFTRAAAAPVADPARAVPSPSCSTRLAHEVKLARDVEPILLSGCSGEFCHRLTSASRAYAFLVNQPSQECDDSRLLVTPGDPDRSYVVDKILGRNLCAGHPMPRGFENRLTPDEIRTVTAWICEGAPND